jgi:hypothetical protein
MLSDLLIWGALFVGLVFVVGVRRGVGALTLAYFLVLSLGHVPGLLAYLDKATLQFVIDTEGPTKIGFDVTLIAMTAFIVSAMAARVLPHRTTSAKADQPTASADSFSRLGWRALALGVVAYFVVLPVSALVPSVTAISSAVGTLLILGFWLQLYASRENRRRKLSVLLMLPFLPLATLTADGFIGFGTVWALSVVAFAFVIARRRIWFYLAAPVVIFLGLSLFVTYFQQRDDIREVVWDERTNMAQRISTVSNLFSDFQLLDLSNEGHLVALDERLNQNYLVGKGVIRHRLGEVELLYGATLPLWALIPRAIWPDKPDVGGGRKIVSQFTDVEFEEQTSVGAGQVLEFYMNFGMPGVVAGFAFLGFILMRLDRGIMHAFAMRDFRGIVQMVLPGLMLLQPLGNLMEILVGLASAIAVSQALVRLNFFGAPPTRRPNAKVSAQTVRVIGRR